MKSNFNKYWGDPEKINHLIFIANILDPRDKFEYMEFSLNTIYGEILSIFNRVKCSLYELFDDYIALYKPATNFVSHISLAEPLSQSKSGTSDSVCKKNVSILKACFKKQKLEKGLIRRQKQEK